MAPQGYAANSENFRDASSFFGEIMGHGTLFNKLRLLFNKHPKAQSSLSTFEIETNGQRQASCAQRGPHKVSGAYMHLQTGLGQVAAGNIWEQSCDRKGIDYGQFFILANSPNFTPQLLSFRNGAISLLLQTCTQILVPFPI